MGDIVMRELSDKIQVAFETHAAHNPPIPEQRYHRHDEYLTYGIKTALLWKIMKDLTPRIREQSLSDRMALAEGLAARHVGELGHAAIYIVSLGRDEMNSSHFPFLDDFVDEFRSWSHVDHFCGEVMQPLLLQNRNEVLGLFDQWSRSKNRWKRRASVVTFTRKIGASGAFTEETLRVCERLIHDEEDIVRKGIGWALKDSLKGSRDRVLPYIIDLRKRGVSSTITLYAIRDLKGSERARIIGIRKP